MPVSRRRKGRGSRAVASHVVGMADRAVPRMFLAEKYVRQGIEYLKRQIANQNLDESAKETIKSLNRIGTQSSDFFLWFGKSPESVWLVEAVEEYQQQERDEDEEETIQEENERLKREKQAALELAKAEAANESDTGMEAAAEGQAEAIAEGGA